MKTFCYNCGKTGHNYYHCNSPIMSYGIILYKIVNNKPYFCLIQRNYTPEFKEIIKGKFDFENVVYLQRLIDKLTIQEVRYINECRHDVLYDNLFRYLDLKKNKRNNNRYRSACEKFLNLLNGIINSKGNMVKFSVLVKNRKDQDRFLEPDWGFPKGRPDHNNHENDLACAIRETLEETGIHPNNYKLLNNQIFENLKGTDNISYCHKYYLAKCPKELTVCINPLNIFQVSEIRKIGWFSFEDAMKMMRPYHNDKKRILAQLNNMIHSKLRQNLRK